MARDLTPGDSVFIPTLLQTPLYTNITGGQRVQNVKQSGDVVVFVSGQGRRSTLVQSVCLHQFLKIGGGWNFLQVISET